MPRTSVPELSLELPTLVDLCRSRAIEQPDRRTYVFLEDGVEESDSLTLGQLDNRARAIAARLREFAPPGARAMLSYPPGLEFVSAFFGCLYAGVIAVPAPPVGRARDARYARFRAIADSCRPDLLLSNAESLDRTEQLVRDPRTLGRPVPVATEEIGDGEAELWSPPRIHPETVAYLQYTSGTTGPPRGVVLTHGNVLHNLALIVANGPRSRERPDRVPPMVSWLPVFHDMGLISNVVQPLFVGFDAVLMSPTAFVQNPLSWLRTISRLGEAISAAPSFGYELCLRRTSEEQRRSLDLSGWRIAIISDESIRAETIEGFSAAFAVSGFRPEAFMPSYGMAESTLLVSGGPVESEPVIRPFDTAALRRGQVQLAGPESNGRRLVGCGEPQASLTVAVVDRVTGQPCGADEVGEILISGPSVGSSYWNAPGETARAFGVTIPGSGNQTYLRTGNLGFRFDGQIFVTCRVSDLIVQDGLQHYPDELEVTVSASHDAVRDGFCCALAIEDGQRLVVLAEISSRYRVRADPTAPPDAERSTRRSVWAGDVKQAIRTSLAAEHGVRVDDVALLKVGSLSFTTSGKLQRSECRSRYLSGALRSAVDAAPRRSPA